MSLWRWGLHIPSSPANCLPLCSILVDALPLTVAGLYVKQLSDSGKRCCSAAHMLRPHSWLKISPADAIRTDALSGACTDYILDHGSSCCIVVLLPASSCTHTTSVSRCVCILS
ncbi:hypothetical protein F4823DRAFT_275372 [Ustulina deusta]|nr:hypothetical protein F4823DRAFT_275372 [Ustulina deusta]